MKKNIIILKKIFIVAGLSSILLIILDLLFKISIQNTNGIYLASATLMFILFLTSLYLFFILSDIQKNKFIYLSWLNFILQILSLTFFIYWGIIESDALAFLYPAYFAIATIFNLIVMSIIYIIKKTGGKYFYKDWLYFLGLIALFVFYIVIMRQIKS
ncbi:hypothetical protein [Flavobacterium sp. K5-23]|uniref:hypothetical protein n=1 Tax=Flavobacterium sp. K5-23 TaxID=2746225 RepID=UPI00200F9F74|nr:hypothetical protein [Flavobacterium sp. K5-23]UQD55674.1 hypothetical protein FLAK523_04400 [Flavobacterium sp. K5-23]